MITRLPKRGNAFTLVEVLVVVAIIAVLAALLSPVFSRAKHSAKISHCASNLRNIGVASVLYRADNADRLPMAAGLLEHQSCLEFSGPWCEAEPLRTVLHTGPLESKLLGYLRSNQVLLCPEDDKPYAAPGSVITSSYIFHSGIWQGAVKEEIDPLAWEEFHHGGSTALDASVNALFFDGRTKFVNFGRLHDSP